MEDKGNMDENPQRMHSKGSSGFRRAFRKVLIANYFKNTRLDQAREAMGDMVDCEPFVRRILLKSPTSRDRDTVETRSSLLGIGICTFIGYIFILVASVLSIHGLQRQEIASGEGILTTIQTTSLNETLNSEDQAFFRSPVVMQIIDEKTAEVGLRKILNAQQPCPLQIIEKDLHIIGTPLEPYARFRDDCPGYFTSGWDVFGNLDEDHVRYLQAVHLSIGFILFGLLLEIFFGTLLLTKTNDTEFLKTYWKLVGAVYPAALSMGAQMCMNKNAFGMLFVTLSLFKFGIPECYILFLTIAEEFSTYKLAKTKLEQFQGFLRLTLCYMVYTAYIIHHTVAIGWFAGCTTGLIPFRRQTFTPTLLLVMIHWFHLLRHVLPSIISSLLQICVESIFILSVLKYLTAAAMLTPYGAVFALCMAMAHVAIMFCEICYSFIETNNKRDKFYATVE